MEIKERTITAKKSFFLYVSEIWDYRELFWILAKRDILVKYKQSLLGVGWSAIRPLITTLAMSFAFGKIGKFGIDSSIPFTLIVSSGVIIWLFFSQTLLFISQSIVVNSNLVTKVYFPRLIIPLSNFFLGIIDVVVSIILFFIFCLYYEYSPDWKIVFVPFIILLTFLSVLGIGLLSSVLNVKYRDIGQIIPFVVQFGFFLSPVGYLTDHVKNSGGSPWYYKLFLLNPVTGAIDLMRWSLLGGFAKFNWDSFIPFLTFTAISLIFSINYFRKHENSFVDHI